MVSVYASLCVYWSWPKRVRKLQIFLVVMSAFFIHFTIGAIYTDGNLIPYIVSYVRERSHPKWLRSTDAIIILAVKEAGATFTMFLGGYLDKWLGPRVVILIGSFIMSIGVLLSYFTIQSSFWAFLFTYGILFGIGNGMACVPPIACAIRWLPKWKGVANGVIACGYGLSGVFLTPLQTLFINFHNLKPDHAPYSDHPDEKYFTQPEILDRVPQIYLVLGSLFLVIQLMGAIFLVDPSPQVQQEMKDDMKREKEEEESMLITSERDDSEETSEDDEIKKQQDEKVPTTTESLKILFTHRNFYLLWLMYFSAGVIVAFVVGLYKAFGFETVTSNDFFLTIVGSVSAIFTAFSRVPWGIMVDFTGYKFAFIFHGAITASFLATFYIATVGGGEVLYFIWVCVIFCGIGGYFAFFPVATARSFGPHNYGMNYGIISTAVGFGTVAGSLGAKYIVQGLDWFGALLVIAGVQVAELVMAIFLRSSDE